MPSARAARSARFGRRAVVAGLLLRAGILAGQRPLTIVHFPLELADLSLVADTASGLTLILQPAVNTRQGRSPESLIWLRFRPDSALEWINSVAYALAAPVPAGSPDGVQWSRALKALNAKGAVTIGRERKKGTLQKVHWLAISDSSTGWRLEISGRQVDSLLRLVMHLGSISRIDTAAAMAREADRVDVPVKAVHQPRPPSRGRLGRVLVQYVVETDGSVVPESLVAYLASDSTLVSDAFHVVRASRFEPARHAGQPVRQLVQQVISWHEWRR